MRFARSAVSERLCIVWGPSASASPFRRPFPLLLSMSMATTLPLLPIAKICQGTVFENCLKYRISIFMLKLFHVSILAKRKWTQLKAWFDLRKPEIFKGIFKHYVQDRSQVLNWILEDHSSSSSSGPAQLSIQVYQDQYSNHHSSRFPAEFPESSVPSLEESYLVKRIVRTISATLTDLSLWQIMDDVLCQIIGQNCLHLSTIDVRKSTKITHFGVRQLLLQITDDQGQIPTALCQTLTEINLSETRLPSFSSLLIIEKCLELTHLHQDQETWTEVWKDIIQQIGKSSEWMNDRIFKLFFIFSKFI